MMSHFHRVIFAWHPCAWIGVFWLFATSGLIAQPEAAPAERKVFIFEGRLERMDSQLAPTLREGQVLSGFFSVFMDAEAEDLEAAPEQARYAGVLPEGDFIFDVNHVIAYQGFRGGGDGWLTLTQGDETDEAPSDVYGVTLPVEGSAFGEKKWQPRWLQIWLTGEPGEMLATLNVQGPPESIRSGWFRISFWDEAAAEEVAAEGTITYIGPEGEALSPTEQIAQLERVVADLSARLSAAETETGRLREELESARRRVNGLNQTLDVLITERSFLQQEMERLEATTGEADAELLEQVAGLEARRVLMEESKKRLETINAELARSVQRREQELLEARNEIQRLIAEKEAAPGLGILDEPVPNSPHPYLAPGQLIPGIRSTREVPVGTPQASDGPAASGGLGARSSGERLSSALPETGPRDARELEESEESLEGAEKSTFPRRPRKFRRGGR